MPMMFTIEESWSATERGNTLLVDDDGNVAAWVDVDASFNLRFKISYSPENYPALSVSLVRLTDEQLVHHIKKTYGGWYARRLNVENIELDGNGHIVGEVDYSNMTDDDEHRLLCEILEQEPTSAILGIGDVYSLLSEELNNDVLREVGEGCSQARFDEGLRTIVQDMTAGQILSYGDVYQELREHFNNEILERWEQEQE